MLLARQCVNIKSTLLKYDNMTIHNKLIQNIKMPH